MMSSKRAPSPASTRATTSASVSEAGSRGPRWCIIPHSSARPRDRLRAGLQRLQVLDEVALLRGRQREREGGVVVRDDRGQVGEAAVVIEAALGVREQALERRRAIALVGRALRLEVVDADLGGGVHVPTGLG